MKKLICNGVPISIAVGICACLALGVAAVYTTVLVVLLVSAALAFNPFGLLDVVLARKARLCLSAGLIMALIAFVQPFGWKVSVFLALLGFFLIIISVRFNGRMIADQQNPKNAMKLEFMHSRYVDETIAAMNADPKNLGESRLYWSRRGIREFRSLMHCTGIDATEEEISRIAERAFCFGRHTIHLENKNVHQLGSKISSLEAENRRLAERISELEEMDGQYRDYIYSDFPSWVDWRSRHYSGDGDDCHYDSEPAPEPTELKEPIPIIPPVGTLTGEMILNLIESGLTQKQISEQFGVPKSTVNYRKKQAEKRRRAVR